MTRLARFGVALLGVMVLALALPHAAHAWTPGTHIYLGESVLQNLQLLPAWIADLLRAFPYDFLYGNIAADSSMAKKYAPEGRNCHAWHVGQEIYDLAGSPATRAFGLGYLCHLSADTVAHNYFVPRQLSLTSGSASVAHSYWESRVETHLGSAFATTAKQLISLDHEESDRHLGQIISPTLFSVKTNRRLFRGMVHLTETPGWQLAFQVVRETSRAELTSEMVERHLATSFDFMMDMLADDAPAARRLDPSGHEPLKNAKVMRRLVHREAKRRVRMALATSVADEHFGLPDRALPYWSRAAVTKPWHDHAGDSPALSA